MKDIAPELLVQLKTRFSERVELNPKIRALYKKIRDGSATYADAGDYAYLVGDALSKAFSEILTPDAIPDGKMYFNIADRVIRPLLEHDHDIVSGAAAMVQAALNQKAGISIKPQTVPVNEDRIAGIIDKVSDAEKFEDVAWVLGEPVKNFSQSVVDETLKANVNFHGRSGLHPKVIRKSERKCCKWCSSLAGEYSYPDVPKDVYRRHERCRCTVDYDPGDGKGKLQNVHTRQWTDPEYDATMDERRIIGLRVNGTPVKKMSQHVHERMSERNITIEAVQDAIEHPLKIGEVKYDEQGRPSFTITGKKATIAINPETGEITTAYPTHTKLANKLMKKGGR